MTDSAANPRHYRFGPFELDAAEAAVSRNGTRLKLQDLPFRLLLMLLQRPGEIISREEVRQHLWPEDTFVAFDNSLGVAIRKVRDALHDDAEAPRYVETVPRRGYRFVAPVTVVEASSPARASEAISSANPAMPAHQPEGQQLPLRYKQSRFGRGWRYGILTALALIGCAAAFYQYRIRAGSRESSPAATMGSLKGVRRSVAVIGFRNLPGHPEDSWLSPAFAEMLNTELAADGDLRMISGEDVARAKRELPLADEDSLAKKTLERLHNNPGADIVVLGAYTPLPGGGEKQIRLDVRLQETSRGETLGEQAFVGKESDLFELVGRAGAALRRSLGASPVSTEAYAQVRAALPSNPLAVKLYTEGQARLWAYDNTQAQALLSRAVAAEPDFPLSHAALSEAWSHLGYGAKARSEIEKARALSTHLSGEEHLLIEGEYYMTLGDRPKAVDIYRRLFTQFPDNLEYGLRLAEQQRWASPEAALQTVMSLKHLPPPVGDDPRLDISEARIWVNRDSSKTWAAAHRAIEKANAQGSRLLVALAYGVLCQASSGSAKDEAIHNCENARQSYSAAGDRDNEARTLNDFAGFYYLLGDVDRSEAMFRQALIVFRKVGDVEGVATISSNMGEISLARGDLTESERLLSEAIPAYQEVDVQDGVALAQNDLAEVYLLRGEQKKSLETYKQAEANALKVDSKTALAYIREGMGNLMLTRNDLGGARTSYENALSLGKQVGVKQAEVETELALARLSLEQRQLASAEAVIRNCKEQFHKDQQADDEFSASIALIEALLAQGKTEEAVKEADEAKPLAAKSSIEVSRLHFNLALSRVELATGHPDAARARLQKALDDSKKKHLLGVEFETRLIQAELEVKLGKKAAAEGELVRLEKDARIKGFDLIAAKAQSQRNPAGKTL